MNALNDFVCVLAFVVSDICFRSAIALGDVFGSKVWKFRISTCEVLFSKSEFIVKILSKLILNHLLAELYYFK